MKEIEQFTVVDGFVTVALIFVEMLLDVLSVLGAVFMELILIPGRIVRGFGMFGDQ